MSSVALPMPKPASQRPPFGPPPSRTTFDSHPGDREDPMHKRIAESVDQVIRACKTADSDDAPLMLRLIDQRKQIVNRELAMVRMMAPSPLPPLLSSLYTLDFLSDETDEERIYVRLLSDLDRAAERMIALIEERNG